jgi:hypothetical protein
MSATALVIPIAQSARQKLIDLLDLRRGPLVDFTSAEIADEILYDVLWEERAETARALSELHIENEELKRELARFQTPWYKRLAAWIDY